MPAALLLEGNLPSVDNRLLQISLVTPTNCLIPREKSHSLNLRKNNPTWSQELCLFVIVVDETPSYQHFSSTAMELRKKACLMVSLQKRTFILLLTYFSTYLFPAAFFLYTHLCHFESRGGSWSRGPSSSRGWSSIWHGSHCSSTGSSLWQTQLQSRCDATTRGPCLLAAQL